MWQQGRSQHGRLKKCLYIFRWKPQEKHRPEGENNIYHGEIAYENMNWTAGAENRMQLRDFM